MYFDLRSNTADPATLPTETILARSSDNGATWRENRLTPAFDLSTAPFAGGHFIGDYMGLVSTATFFVPVYVRTTGTTNNRTEVYAVFARSALALGPARSVDYRVVGAETEPSASAQQRTSETITRVLERRRADAIVRTKLSP
jgi:hypothetical protein